MLGDERRNRKMLDEFQRLLRAGLPEPTTGGLPTLTPDKLRQIVYRLLAMGALGGDLDQRPGHRFCDLVAHLKREGFSEAQLVRPDDDTLRRARYLLGVENRVSVDRYSDDGRMG